MIGCEYNSISALIEAASSVDSIQKWEPGWEKQTRLLTAVILPVVPSARRPPRSTMDRHAVERPKWPRFFGDWGWLKIFPTGDAADAWSAEHDPEAWSFNAPSSPPARDARGQVRRRNRRGTGRLKSISWAHA